MAWLVLVVAGACECGWAIGLKYIDGLRRPVVLALTLAGMGISFAGLTWSLRHLPVGTAYAVWTGIGAAGTAVLGIILFNEPLTALRVASIVFVIVGIAGLRLAS